MGQHTPFRDRPHGPPVHPDIKVVDSRCARGDDLVFAAVLESGRNTWPTTATASPGHCIGLVARRQALMCRLPKPTGTVTMDVNEPNSGLFVYFINVTPRSTSHT